MAVYNSRKPFHATISTSIFHVTWIKQWSPKVSETHGCLATDSQQCQRNLVDGWLFLEHFCITVELYNTRAVKRLISLIVLIAWLIFLIAL